MKLSELIANKTLPNGFSLPALGLGTWLMGGGMTRDVSNDDDADIAAIRAAIEEGLIHIDTAELYAAGHTEELVGAAIRGFPRDRLLLASKVFPSGFRRRDVIAAAERSLARLGTDYLDLYMLHRYPGDEILGESLEGISTLIDDGKVRWAGVSNFSVSRLARAIELSKHPIVANQVHYSVAAQEAAQTGLVNYCREKSVLVVAYRPVERGVAVRLEVPIVRELAAKYGKSPAQVAINWLAMQENVVVIVQTRSRAHLRENIAALGFELTSDDAKRLYEEYPDDARIPATVSLRD